MIPGPADARNVPGAFHRADDPRSRARPGGCVAVCQNPRLESAYRIPRTVETPQRCRQSRREPPNRAAGRRSVRSAEPGPRSPPVAVLWMVAVVLLDGMAPTFRVFIPAVGALWLTVWLQCGAAAAHFAYVVAADRRLVASVLAQPAVLRRHLRSRYLWAGAAGRLEVLLLIAAVTVLGPTLPSVVFAMWPLVWAVGLQRTARDDQGPRYPKLAATRWGAAAGACAGCGAVAAAQPARVAAGRVAARRGARLVRGGPRVGSLRGVERAVGDRLLRRGGHRRRAQRACRRGRGCDARHDHLDSAGGRGRCGLRR